MCFSLEKMGWTLHDEFIELFHLNAPCLSGPVCLMLGTVVGELELLSCIVDFVQSIALAQRRASRTNSRSNCSSFILFYTQRGNMSFKVIIFH